MTRHLQCIVVVLAVVLALPGLAAAQSTTSGSIRGQVTDGQGGVLPGVTVIAVSDALVAGRQTAVTGPSGVYRFPSLPPGTYQIEAHLQGFQSVRRADVELRLGQALEIDLELSDVVVSDEIVVVAEAAQVSTVDNTISYNLTPDYLERQPLPRDTTQLMDYTPGINNGAAYGSPNSQATAYNLDGVDVSDPASGQQWILPNMNWIEEVQVTGLGADAEYGGFTGAVVNLITKSGGNEFKGDVAAYYSDSSLNGDNAPEGYQSTSEIDTDWEINFGLGGKLIQDKLWYFVSGEERSRKLDPFFIGDAFAAPPGEIEKYQRDYHRYLAKLTFQADDANRLSFLVDYDGVETTNRDIGADGVVLASAAYDQDSPNWSYNASWESLVNDSNFVAVKLTGFTGSNDYLPHAGSDVPGRRDYFNSELEWQNYQYTWLVDKDRLNLDASWSVFADGLFTEGDSHNFKFGLVYEDSGQDEVRTRNGGLTYDDDSYYCDSLEAYFADPSCGLLSSTQGGEIDFHAAQKGLHAYAQDSWKTSRVTVNYGVRYTTYQGGFSNGDDDVYDVDMVAPRIGMVWDVTGDGSTAFKVHYGRYYDALMAFMYDREISGDAFSDREYWDYNFDTGEFDIYYGRAVVARALMDPGISHPYVDQYVASIERQLTDTTLVGLDYVHRENNDIIAMINTNMDYTAIELVNPLTDEPLTVYALRSEQQNLLTNPGAATRELDSAILRFDRRYADGWSLRASLVWSDLTGNNDDVDGYETSWEDLNGQINNTGKLSNFSEWELKLNASVDLPWGIVASGYYRFLSGEYWTPYVRFEAYELDPATVFNDRSSVNILPRGSEQLEDRHLVDVHLDKRFSVASGVDMTVIVDVFNLLNDDAVIGINQRYGTLYDDGYFDAYDNYREATSIVSPREIRLGLRLSF